MQEPTSYQQNALDTYRAGGYSAIQTYAFSQDPYTVYVNTGTDLVAARYLIDGQIKLISWGEMSPAMRDEVHSWAGAGKQEAPQQSQAATQTASAGHTRSHYFVTPKKWRDSHHGKYGFLPEVIMSVGFLTFLLCVAVGTLSGSAVSLLTLPIVGALMWFALCVVASVIRTMRAIETYTANIYEQLKALDKYRD